MTSTRKHMIVNLPVFLAAICLLDLISGCSTAPETTQFPLEEAIIGTWILPEESEIQKYVIREDGHDEIYISKNDTKPFYWSEYVPGRILLAADRTEWLEVAYFSIPPFSDQRIPLGNAIMSVSPDGSELYVLWGGDEPIDSPDEFENPTIHYREGTQKAASIVDLPHVSEHIVLWHSGPAFLWIIGTNDLETIANLEREAESDGSITMDILEWETFIRSIENIAEDFTVIDEFGNQVLIPGLIQILRSHEDFPVSLTWNSGIAIAQNNYEVAGESYRKYIKDPEAYFEDEIQSMINYSISPEVWFSAILHW